MRSLSLALLALVSQSGCESKKSAGATADVARVEALQKEETNVLARRTEWDTRGDGASTGVGQRVLATDANEYPLLEVRHVVLGRPDGQAAGAGDAEAEAGGERASRGTAGGASGHG